MDKPRFHPQETRDRAHLSSTGFTPIVSFIALIDKGFRDFGVQRVVASTAPDNVASRRVMEKVGMTFVRAYMMTDPDEPQGEAVEYAVTRAAWERRNRNG